MRLIATSCDRLRDGWRTQAVNRLDAPVPAAEPGEGGGGAAGGVQAGDAVHDLFGQGGSGQVVGVAADLHDHVVCPCLQTVRVTPSPAYRTKPCKSGTRRSPARHSSRGRRDAPGTADGGRLPRSIRPHPPVRLHRTPPGKDSSASLPHRLVRRAIALTDGAARLSAQFATTAYCRFTSSEVG